MNRLDQMLARGSTKPKKKRDNPEYRLQKAVVQYLRLALPTDAILFHVPNGEQRSKTAAAKLKAMGTLAGIPDLCVIWQGKTLFIELKAGRGKPSPDQETLIPKLEAQGAPVWVCRSVEEVESALCGVIPLRASAKGNCHG